MKNILKTLTIVALVCLMLLSMAACGSTPEKPDASDPAQTTGAANGIDYSAYPEDFNAWNTSTMQTYLKDCGLLGNESFLLMDMSAGELEAMTLSGGFLYTDSDMGSVMDIVCSYDLSDEAGKAAYDSAVENKAIMVGDQRAMELNAIVGQFVFNYMDGTDEDQIAAVTEAVRALGEHYSVETLYIQEN